MIHLHQHTTFSFLDGYGTPRQLAERIVELGYDACAVTDHGNVYAHVPWQKACRQVGIKPIFGCEFYVVDDADERGQPEHGLYKAQSLPHVTVIALTQKGYENLLKLSRLSWDKFYYYPRTDWPTLIRYEEGLAIFSGCIGGYVNRMIRAGDVDGAFKWIDHVGGRIENFYIELVPEPGIEACHQTMPWLLHMAHDLKLPVVMTADGHFPRPEDYQVQDLMLAVGLNKRVKDEDRLSLPSYQFTCSDADIIARAKYVLPDADPAWFTNALQNAARLGKLAEVEIPHGKPVIYPKCNGLRSEDVLWDQIAEGANQRHVAHNNAYAERACYEFEVINGKGFCDYILAIADVVRWMKSQDSLVMLRGSAGGCLLLYLLGASDIDPIVHGLSFERFYNPTRPDPPDVDIDFERGRRADAIEYVYETYGRENCSQVAALSQLKAKAAVQDAARALGIPIHEVAPLKAALDSNDEDVDRQLTEVTDPTALAVLEKYPGLRIASKMIGQYRQSSTHAAGVLISSQPLDKVIGVVLDKDKKPVAAVDKKGAQDIGLLKMDFLAVNGLDIIAHAVRQIGKPMSWLATLPLDDTRTLDVANMGLLAGIFQLDGASATRVARQIGLNRFEDLAIASALCRPGPSDWVDTYRINKANPERFQKYLDSMHPIAADIVRETYGILLYQEQVMRLARELANFDWPDVHQLRKDVAEKTGLDPVKGPKWRAEWEGKFIDGAVANGVSKPGEAEFWWESIQTHGGYSFNKSHCTTYGMVSYYMLYLKAHHPLAFYSAYMALDDDPITVKRLIAEFRSMSGQVRLLDPRYSRAQFTSVPAENAIVGGFTSIKGIGPKIAEKIMAISPDGFSSWESMLGAMPLHISNRIRATGVDTGCWDVQATILLAPWFPIPVTGAVEDELRSQYGVSQLNTLPSGQALEGNVLVGGYVTTTVFDRDRVMIALEDPHRVIICRVSSRAIHGGAAHKVRQLLVSDYVAVEGWWSGDAIYVRDVQVLKRRSVE